MNRKQSKHEKMSLKLLFISLQNHKLLIVNLRLPFPFLLEIKGVEVELKIRGAWGHGIFGGYWRKCMQKFQRSIRSGISRVDQDKIMMNFHEVWFLTLEFPKGFHITLRNFQGWIFFFSGISKSKVTNVIIPKVFSKNYALNSACLDFFWNGPMLVFPF